MVGWATHLFFTGTTIMTIMLTIMTTIMSTSKTKPTEKV